MKKKLLIHAGVHRTGTTAVQGLLAANAEQLKRNGIIYPTYYGKPDAVNHTQLAWDIHNANYKPEELKSWAESLERKRGHIVVLSAEDFSILPNLDFLDGFLELFDVEVVFYLRRQDDWVNSWYNQNVKWPISGHLFQCTPTEFLGHLDEFHWIGYFDLADRWAKKVGKENIRIRIVEKGQTTDSSADFCNLCGIDFELEKKTATRHNESMPASQIEIIRRLGTYQYSWEVRSKIYVALRELRGSSDSNVYPRAIRQLILARYEVQNQMVAEHYLGREDKVLFRDMSMADPKGNVDEYIDQDLLFTFARNLIKAFSADSEAISSERRVSSGS